MFYIKSRGRKINLRNDNVFTRCPVCGREHAVDIVETFRGGFADLYGILKQSRRMRQFSLSRAVKSSARRRTPLPSCGSTEPIRWTGGALSYIRTQ